MILIWAYLFGKLIVDWWSPVALTSSPLGRLGRHPKPQGGTAGLSPGPDRGSGGHLLFPAALGLCGAPNRVEACSIRSTQRQWLWRGGVGGGMGCGRGGQPYSGGGAPSAFGSTVATWRAWWLHRRHLWSDLFWPVQQRCWSSLSRDVVGLRLGGRISRFII